MSQIYIIVGVLGTISLLVCYIFIRQTIVKKNKEKARLQRALLKRSKFLVQTLEAFPEGFLTPDLSILLLRSIVDTLEQLTQLEPNNSQFVDQLKFYTQKTEEFVRSVKEEKAEAMIDNSSQINELRQSLNQLVRFIQSWNKRGNISQKQFGVYKTQIKKLSAQLMVDNYLIVAAQSVETDKLKLGIHYYTLAKNLILEEGLTKIKHKQLTMIEETLPSLQTTLDNESDKIVEERDAQAIGESNRDNAEWNDFEENDDWKKKNFYD